MPGEPKLRSVSSKREPESEEERSGRRSGPPIATILLGIALAITLVLLVWSRAQLGSRIDALEHEARVLREAVAERDRVIDAHQARLDAVRDRVQELHTLLDEPLPPAP
jgi:hypothetical protein